MTGNEYQKMAYRTCNPENFQRMMVIPDDCASVQDFGDLVYGCIGLSGETGEFVDLIKKMVFHAKREDNFREHCEKELGDICWYVALCGHALGIDLDSIMATNIKKLSERYNGGGFDYSRANNRKEGDI